MIEIDKLAKRLKLPFIRANYKEILETAKQKGYYKPACEAPQNEINSVKSELTMG